MAGVTAIIFGLVVAQDLSKNLEQGFHFGIADTLKFWAVIVSAPLGVWLLLRIGKRTPVIYLRAFRSDRPARRLRRLLKAALGIDFRLSGIRSPRRRPNLVVRLFTQTFTAFRYLGSEHFELEAEDHNWMARLLASYARTPYVFIDVRDVTPHVETEIQLSYRAMGPERCVFIIDPNNTATNWNSTICALVGLVPGGERTFHLLPYPGDEQVDRARFIASTRQIIDRLPFDSATIGEEAIAFAQKNVGDGNWGTPFLETDAATTLFSTLAIILLVFSLTYLVLLGAQSENLWLIRACAYVWVISLTFLYVFYLLAWARAWRQSSIEARYRRSTERDGRWRLSLALLLILVPVALLARGLAPKPHAKSFRTLDKSIAVLPFENLSDDYENAGLADRVQQDLLTNLSKVSELRVIPREAVMRYRGETHNVSEIGKALGASAILEGNARVIGDRVRIMVELISTTSDNHIWAEIYDRDLTDLPAIQSDLVIHIASALDVRILPSEKAEIEKSPR
jgi:TolB-like protein